MRILGLEIGTRKDAYIGAGARGDGLHGLAVEPLGRPAFSQEITTGAASAFVTLNAATTRVSIYATKAARFRAGDAGGAVTAVATDHFIGDGERLDFIVPINSKLAAIQSAAAGVFYVTELA